jgi:membrane-associated protease RseP (regulator of RpoE activity)
MEWPWLAPALWLGLALASTVHELGHALVIGASGARVTSLHIGPDIRALRWRCRGVELSVNLLFPVGGACVFQGPLSPPAAVLERAAGCLANLLVAAMLALSWTWIAGVLGWSLLVAQLATGLGQLLPLRSLDGAGLLRLLRRRVRDIAR